MSSIAHESRCGLVAIVGRPNVGKSTLLNCVLGQKLSITSRKPHTTRYQIVGVKTTGSVQTVYIDTPGLDGRCDRALSRYLNREAMRALAEVDVIVFMIEALRWIEADRYVLDQIRSAAQPVILAINKVDTVTDKSRLLPFLQELGAGLEFAEWIPISARRSTHIAVLEQAISSRLPLGPHVFPEEQITDRDERFFAGELIREKLMRKLGQEVPYQLSVVIDCFEEKEHVLVIAATIWVERRGQKRIVIGKEGALLKAVGHEARKDMEQLFGKQVFLQTWVKIKEHWSDDARALRELGYSGDSSHAR